MNQPWGTFDSLKDSESHGSPLENYLVSLLKTPTPMPYENATKLKVTKLWNPYFKSSPNTSQVHTVWGNIGWAFSVQVPIYSLDEDKMFCRRSLGENKEHFRSDVMRMAVLSETLTLNTRSEDGLPARICLLPVCNAKEMCTKI